MQSRPLWRDRGAAGFLVATTIPNGCLVQGSSWSQIQGAGAFSEDAENPQVVVRVGEEEGEEGSVQIVQIVEMIFTTRGPTAGAIVLQWNIHEASQGSGTVYCLLFFSPITLSFLPLPFNKLVGRHPVC